MKAYFRVALVALCAFFVAPVQAGDARLMVEYSGTVTNMLDAVPGDTVIISEAHAKGSFGATRVTVISKFLPPVPAYEGSPCVVGTELYMPMDYAHSTTLFKDFSQLFVNWDFGWICATPGPSGMASYRGFVSGHIAGGEGRFAGATGENIETNFGGHDLMGPFVPGSPMFPTLGTFNGSLDGTVNLAE